MPPLNVMEAKRAINGREGKVFAPNNVFLGWVESIDARTVIDRQDIVRSGSHTTGYKPIGSTGTGTLNGFHTTTYFRKMIADYTKNAKMPDPCSITIELSDPDQYEDAQGNAQVETCVLGGVYFWEAPHGFDATAIVMDDIPFTYETADYTSVIQKNGTDPSGITGFNPAAGQLA